MKKTLLMILAFLLLATGCSSDPTGHIFKCDIPGPVENLDPQFATDPTAQMVIANIYEGLLIQQPDGSLEPGVAHTYTVSPNGLAYTFQLREDAAWSDGTPLTADDFVFAFRRLFRAGASSPHAPDYTAIQGARQVMAGELDPEQLGVAATDSHTLRITLEHPSPYFLESLAATPAMPCNEEFFVESRSRYGLELQFLLSNGPFSLTRWNNERYIYLRASENYVSDTPVLSGGANLYIDRGDPLEQFLGGNADFAQLDHMSAGVMGENQSLISFQENVWCIVLNQSDPVWGNALLRQGLAHTVDYASMAQQLSSSFQETSVFVPPAILLGETPYRDYGPKTSPLAFNVEQGERLFSMGYELLNLDETPSAILYVPEEDDHALYMGMAYQGWQKNLSVYITIESEPLEDIQDRFASGDYEMLLLPFSPSSPRIESLFSLFTSGSPQNHFGYRSDFFDEIYGESLDQRDFESALDKYIQAETLLLSDTVVIPMYFETTYYAMAEGVEGLQVFPYGNTVYFKHGLKN